MRCFKPALVWSLVLMTLPVMALAEMRDLTVTLSYRERIAPPPGAELDVQLVGKTRLAAQRVAVTSVPVTVVLRYDPDVAGEGADHMLLATLSAPDGQALFGAVVALENLDGAGPVDVVLRAMPAPDAASAVPQTIAGTSWAVTEMFGLPWGDEPATLTVDDAMGVSVFGGCNRYRGQIVMAANVLFFSGDMAGTLMACPDEIEARERRLMAALQQVAGFVRYGGGLVLTDAAGGAVLHLAETPE